MSSRFLAAVNDAGEMFSASTAPDIASQLTALSRRQRKPTRRPKLGPFTALAENQEPESARFHARGRGGLGALNYAPAYGK
jgi:hypothetical protein